MTTEFRLIPNYPDYCVGDDGSVWSSKYGNWRRLKTSIDREGYHRVKLHNPDKKPKDFFVHVLVLTTFVGPRPAKMECLHDDSNPGNNCLHNLRWGTKCENEEQRKEIGKQKGEGNIAAKITEKTVIWIRQQYQQGTTYRELGSRCGLDASTVGRIVRRDLWSHVN